ncbi:MAG: FIST domain protein, partial [Planctomycetota bacterium]|nr:FIST domain protein [Planctomycetota bacterium]
MTESAVVWTSDDDSGAAGNSLAEQVLAELKGEAPDALILFISPKYDAAVLLRAVEDSCHPKVMMGCSSAGEFTSESHGVGHASAVALRSTEMKFACRMGRGLQGDRAGAARNIVAGFQGVGK